MSVIDTLTNMSIDYDSMIADILPNMHRSMFDKTQWKAIEITPVASSEYTYVDRDYISKVHNATHEMLREEISMSAGIISANTAPEDAVAMSVFKNGNKLIVYTPSTMTNFYLNIDKVEKIDANISDSLRKDLLSLF